MADAFAPKLSGDIRPESPVMDSALGETLGNIANIAGTLGKPTKGATAGELKAARNTSFFDRVEQAQQLRAQGKHRQADILVRNAAVEHAKAGGSLSEIAPAYTQFTGTNIETDVFSPEELLHQEFVKDPQHLGYILSARRELGPSASQQDIYNKATQTYQELRLTGIDWEMDLNKVRKQVAVSIASSLELAKERGINLTDRNVQDHFSGILTQLNMFKSMMPADADPRMINNLIGAVEAQSNALTALAANTKGDAVRDQLVDKAATMFENETDPDKKVLYGTLSLMLERDPVGTAEMLRLNNFAEMADIVHDFGVSLKEIGSPATPTSIKTAEDLNRAVTGLEASKSFAATDSELYLHKAMEVIGGLDILHDTTYADDDTYAKTFDKTFFDTLEKGKKTDEGLATEVTRVANSALLNINTKLISEARALTTGTYWNVDTQGRLSVNEEEFRKKYGNVVPMLLKAYNTSNLNDAVRAAMENPNPLKRESMRGGSFGPQVMGARELIDDLRGDNPRQLTAIFKQMNRVESYIRRLNGQRQRGEQPVPFARG